MTEPTTEEVRAAAKHWETDACDCAICQVVYSDEFRRCSGCNIPTLETEHGHGCVSQCDADDAEFFCCECARCDCRKPEWKANRRKDIAIAKRLADAALRASERLVSPDVLVVQEGVE